MVSSISVIIKKETKIFVSFSGTKIFLKMILALFFILPASKSYSQGVKFYPTAGITWRSTVMNVFNLKSIVPADPSVPYSYERNVQGLALNLGLQIEFFNYLTIEYYPSLRYDVTHVYFDPETRKLVNVYKGDSIYINDQPIYIKEFLVDHNFNLIFNRKIDIGVIYLPLAARRREYSFAFGKAKQKKAFLKSCYIFTGSKSDSTLKIISLI